MNNGMDLFIGKDKFLLCKSEQGTPSLELGTTPAEFSKQFSAFASDNTGKQCPPVTIYIGEDLLYFTHLNLPKQTPDVKKAINLQLNMISPFGEHSLQACEITHGETAIDVALYLVDKQLILPVLETIVNQDWQISGMYPESQRGLTKENRKQTWGLLSTGLFNKLTIFKAGHVSERLQISGTPDQIALKKAHKLDFIQDKSNLQPLPSPPLSPFAFDLLPRTFRRTDYVKWALVGLIGLNLILGLSWLSMNFVNLQNKINTIETTQTELALQLQEAKKLQRQHATQTKKLKSYESLARNKNMVSLLATLSRGLPGSSYLDQLRLDKKTKAIHIQGYTTNLSDLTASLQVIGNATLESTRKRKGKTYFQIEVLPK